MKICTTCKIEKDESEFGKHSRRASGLSETCRDCSTARTKQWRNSIKGNRVVRQYGITTTDYTNLLRLQDNRCAICKRPFDRVNIDHSHSTGNVRGLLCIACNRGLGFFNDNVEYLQAAIDYMKKQSLKTDLQSTLFKLLNKQ